MKLSLLLAFGVLAAGASAQFISFNYFSEPRDAIGQGRFGSETYWRSESPIFEARAWQLSSLSGGIDTIFLSGAQAPRVTNRVDLFLTTAAFGRPMATGIYQSGGQPLFQVSFEGRRPESVLGQIHVKEFRLDSRGHLDRFLATFSQYANGSTGALNGTISYAAVPEPANMAALGTGLLWVALRRKKHAAKA